MTGWWWTDASFSHGQRGLSRAATHQTRQKKGGGTRKKGEAEGNQKEKPNYFWWITFCIYFFFTPRFSSVVLDVASFRRGKMQCDRTSVLAELQFISQDSMGYFVPLREGRNHQISQHLPILTILKVILKFWNFFSLWIVSK